MNDNPNKRVPSGRSLLAAAVIVLLLMGSVMIIHSRKASLKLDRKLAQLRKDGIPVTDADLAALFPDPDPAHDARLILKSALAWTPGLADTSILPFISTNGTLQLGVPIRAEVMVELDRHLEGSDAVLAMLSTNLDEVRFPNLWTNGSSRLSNFPSQEVRRLGQAMALKVVYESEQQHPSRAVESLRAGYHLAGTLSDKSVPHLMMRNALCGLMCSALEQAVNRCRFDDAGLAELQRVLNRTVALDFKHASLDDLVSNGAILDEFRNGSAQHASDGVVIDSASLLIGARPAAYREEDHLRFLSAVEDRRSAESLPGPARFRRICNIRSNLLGNVRSVAFEYLFLRWDVQTKFLLEHSAKLACARAALAVERYRLAHEDRLPDSLKSLVPGFLAVEPLDPMDQQPLRYKRLDHGYVIYSIGIDGEDDGGKQPATAVYSATHRYDVTFTVVR